MYTEEQAKGFIQSLNSMAKELGVEKLADYVLADLRFTTGSGSSKRGKHHYGDYGLLVHTYEVVDACMTLAEDVFYQYDIDKQVLFLSALYHDYGKAKGYSKGKYGEWDYNDVNIKLHHIPNSFLHWNESLTKYQEARKESDWEDFESIRDSVSHAILAHHGRKEWSSPVTPKTREAWLLHLADGMSARLNDCLNYQRENK
jgi:3'-5' exoribonuclease